MLQGYFIITNNPLCWENYYNRYKIEFVKGNFMEVLITVRDYVHKGHILLTHPLSSSLKPDQTPYKTVVISKNRNNYVDINSLEIMEKSINTAEKFLNDFNVNIPDEKIKADFQFVDFDIIANIFN